MDVAALANAFPQTTDSARIDVDEEMLPEGRPHQERVQRAARHEVAGGPGHVNTGTCKGIDVDMVEPGIVLSR